MILPDVNVLLYAFRSDAPDHKRYLHWLEDVVNGPSAYAMAPRVLSGFIRVATHPRVYNPPSRVEEAISFTEALRQSGRCHLIEPGPRHWDLFTNICRTCAAKGNLVADAWLAALAIESGCEWVTTNGDFARFESSGLRWRRPF